MVAVGVDHGDGLRAGADEGVLATAAHGRVEVWTGGHVDVVVVVSCQANGAVATRVNADRAVAVEVSAQRGSQRRGERSGVGGDEMMLCEEGGIRLVAAVSGGVGGCSRGSGDDVGGTRGCRWGRRGLRQGQRQRRRRRRWLWWLWL